MGRTKLSEEERLHHVAFRCTKATRDQIEAAAEETGVRPAVLIRMLVDDGMRSGNYRKVVARALESC